MGFFGGCLRTQAPFCKNLINNQRARRKGGLEIFEIPRIVITNFMIFLHWPPKKFYILHSGPPMQFQDPGTENNPYLGFVYTSFQERATFISHGNTARMAKERGDHLLARICGTIAADEKRHENAYTKIVEKLLEVDPSDAILAVEDMMRKKITMPAHLMHDGRDPHLFEHFSAVAQRLGVYTANDYADIVEFLVGRWKLDKQEGLTSSARRAQDFVCGLAPRIRKLQERAEERARLAPPRRASFSWIFNKEISL